MKKVKDKDELEQILQDAWLNIKVDEEKLFNPLKYIPVELEDEPHLYIMWLMSRPEYFSFVCSEIFNVQLLPMQSLMLKEIWHRRFPMLIMSRGGGKSFMLGLYALMRLTLMPGRRIVICGAAFRQSKIIFDYMESIWKNAPLLRDLVNAQRSGPKRDTDMCRFHISESLAVALPIGDGSRIRGQRANDILMDEFASLSREIFENVIAGFAAVKALPIEHVKRKAYKDAAKKLGIKLDAPINSGIMDNQIVISGTAYYDFNHFAEYWKRWKAIIQSEGNPDRLTHIFGDEDIPEDFNWRDYSIIRIPYELIPKGFMDEAMVARSKATIHSGIYSMEYGSVFSNDSNGFFKRSLIESCVVGGERDIVHNSINITFRPRITGDINHRYVFGIDPASEVDNFSIIILEVHREHRRIVFCWTTTRADHREKLKAGLVKETDFYGYCARKIRELMETFPCDRIVMDSQGGGIAVSEALHDKEKLRQGEHQIWPIIDPNKPVDTDMEVGLHLIDMANFASSTWTEEANHGMRKDFEDKICLFPEFDPAMIEIASIADQKAKRIYDTLEDCILEIEELKNELCTIIIEPSPSGRDRWVTPEIKLPGNRKGRLRKDRYSALIMANMGARQMFRNPTQMAQSAMHGGWAMPTKPGSDKDFTGPAWFTDKMKGIYD